jgi:periplasmic protein TonB
MPAHLDILDQRDSLKTPLAASLAAHVGLATLAVLYTSLGAAGRVLWGTPHSLGGGNSVGITAVSQIPLPSRSGQINPLANDTESRVPAPPKPQSKAAVKAPEPEAIPLRGRKNVARERQMARNYQPYQPSQAKPNQLYSGAGQALASNMFSSQTGTGGVGVGPRSAFGTQYGWYRDLLEQRIAQKWRTDEVDPRIQTAPPAIVTFEIQRNGSIRDVRVLQSSGNYALDNSARRAVFDASPFPTLPNDFGRSSASIEIWFQLKR